MRVLTKTACFIANVWHAAGADIEIAEEHFAKEVHHLLGEDGQIIDPAPVAPATTRTVAAGLTAPANENTPTDSPDVPLRSSSYTIGKPTLDEPDTSGEFKPEAHVAPVAPLPEDVPAEHGHDVAPDAEHHE